MSEYTDIKNNTYKISHITLVSMDERKQKESEIIEELCRVFLKN